MILLFDAHNHLHDQRLIPSLQEIVPVMQEAGIARCVVNGTCEEDWPRVAELAEQFPDLVQPSFGLHPWKVPSRTSGWLENLRGYLDQFEDSCLGECGLDSWI
jgi:TatD DNase family protein